MYRSLLGLNGDQIKFTQHTGLNATRKVTILVMRPTETAMPASPSASTPASADSEASTFPLLSGRPLDFGDQINSGFSLGHLLGAMTRLRGGCIGLILCATATATPTPNATARYQMSRSSSRAGSRRLEQPTRATATATPTATARHQSRRRSGRAGSRRLEQRTGAPPTATATPPPTPTATATPTPTPTATATPRHQSRRRSGRAGSRRLEQRTGDVAGLRKQIQWMKWSLAVTAAWAVALPILLCVWRRWTAHVEVAVAAKADVDGEASGDVTDGLAAIQEEMSDVTNRLAAIEQEQKNLCLSISGFHGKVDRYGDDLGEVKQAIADLRQQLDNEVSGMKEAMWSIRGEGSGQDADRVPDEGERDSDDSRTALRQEIEELRAKNERLHARLDAVEQILIKEFPPLIGRAQGLEVPDGIIRHLTREWGGDLGDRNIRVTASGVYDNNPNYKPGNATDLDQTSHFVSACRAARKDIPHERNNWICYDFRRRRIVPKAYAIRSCDERRGGPHLRSWLVEVSVDGENWTEIDHHEHDNELNGYHVVQTFSVQQVTECRYIRLVNIGRTHCNDDAIHIEAWEIFGTLIG
jgi:hypothetical protein